VVRSKSPRVDKSVEIALIIETSEVSGKSE
jgi:hypothetical protein